MARAERDAPAGRGMGRIGRRHGLAHERDRVALDPVDTNAIEVRERCPELIDLGERQRGVVELLRRAIDVVSMIVELLLDVQRAVPVDSDAVEELPPHEERSEAES